MIAQIQGTVSYMKENAAVIMVSGVGYKVFVSPYTLGNIAGGGTVTLHTHTYVREDSLSLYGFLTVEELDMFELLISVSGIGPKAGLGILSISDPNTLRAAIINHDASILTRVSGVGKKTAERVILDLENKVGNISEIHRTGAVLDTDAMDALTAMGYAVAEAREALKMAPADMTDVGEKVKFALKHLGRK
ncbi:MAG: Holliday junction branch migration protein RuvA [Candidatus Moranbacteria bacterium]|nr:Holliday junction branch migration protein RuvA [Candidatus Moranbacteria bacterium]